MTPDDFSPRIVVRQSEKAGTSSTRPGLPPYSTDPTDILYDSALSNGEKREILADWASDRRAMANLPSLRQLDDGTIHHIDTILDALKSLDTTISATNGMARDSRSVHSARMRRSASSVIRWLNTNRKGFRPDDDDDPPPCPAAAILPPGPPPMSDGAIALAAA